MREDKSIIYVNFAPYENAGRILDYLTARFSTVILFSYDFHEIKNNPNSNNLRIFEDGKEVKKIGLFKLPTPEFLVLITLPFIALLILIQTIWYIFRLKNKYGKFDIYLTVNAFTAWIGDRLRQVGLVDRTIFWVWDYYPPGHPDLRIKIARWIYWKFDRWSTKSSSSVIFLNKRLEALRKEIGVIPKNKSFSTVPIGTNPQKPSLTKQITIGHLGVLKESQGLDLLIDNLKEVNKLFPKVKVEILGTGPEESYFKKKTKGFKNVTFFGFIKDENEVDKIIRNWSLGIATYKPGLSNPSYWTDPSKIKAYVSQGVPVITTEITTISRDLEKSGAGKVIDYHDNNDFLEGLSEILNNQTRFKKNAYNFAKRYEFMKIYNGLFKFSSEKQKS